MATNIGILGFAHGHVSTYCEQWRAMSRDRVNVVSGWDHDSKRGTNACGKFAAACETSADAVVRRDDVSAVVIGTETSLHADMVELAAAAGKAIVLQKPMALTIAEADRIVTAVEKHRVPCTLAWQMRVDPQNLRMKQLLSEGKLGKLLHVRRRHGLSTHVWAGFENSWHASRSYNRGMWADDASHAIDFLLWLCGKPATVTAEIETLVNPNVPDDNGAAIFRYADGTIAEISCSFTAVAGENTCELTGAKGVAIQNFGDAVSCNPPRAAGAVGLKWYTTDTNNWTDSGIASPSNHSERIKALAGPLLEFMEGKRPSICSAAEGRTSLAMTLACYESAETGRRVTINA